MKFLLFKNRVKRAWLWLKHHWYIPLIIMGFVIAFLIFLVSKNSMAMGLLSDLLENARKSHRDEVDKLNEIHARATSDRARILDEYNKNIDKLEKEYAERDEDLDEKKKKEIKRLVEKGYNNPDVLARELARLYGFENG